MSYQISGNIEEVEKFCLEHIIFNGLTQLFELTQPNQTFITIALLNE